MNGAGRHDEHRAARPVGDTARDAAQDEAAKAAAAVGADDDDGVAAVAGVVGDGAHGLAILHDVERRGRAGEAPGEVVEVDDLGHVAWCDAAVRDHPEKDELGGEPLGEIGGDGQRPFGQLRAVDADDQSPDTFAHPADGRTDEQHRDGELRSAPARRNRRGAVAPSLGARDADRAQAIALGP